MLQIKNVTKIRSIAEAVFKNDQDRLQRRRAAVDGHAGHADRQQQHSVLYTARLRQDEHGGHLGAVFVLLPVLRPDAGAGKQVFQPYEEPISKLDIVGGPDTTTYSGGYVSSGEEDNVWGDTSGSYDYSEDYYEEPDYSYDEPSYDNSGSDGDYSDNNDYSGGDSGGDYSGGDSGEESGGDSSGGDYTDGGGEDSGASSGGDDGGTYDPEA